jgi:phospholipid-binding lipoprotein MlaA
MYQQLFKLLLLVSSLVLVGCSSAPDEKAGKSEVNDPLEGFNRTMWSFNIDYLDPYVIRPAAVAYVNYVPVPVRKGLSNIFSNLDEPASMVNNILMGNGRKAADHFNRFWINSTFGLFGLIDIASAAGIEKHDDKSLSDAIGHYGVGNGPYVMLPAVGPYTPRNVAGFVDSSYAPLSYLNIWGMIGKYTVSGLETRASLINQEAMLDNSPDPYALTRDAFLQHQDFKAEINNDNYDKEQEDNIDEYLDGL